MSEIEMLGAFDRAVASGLFQHYPDWEVHARAEDDGGEKALVVAIPVPNPRIAGDLEINTFDLQVTVHFDRYHGHFDALDDEALALIGKIVSDSCSVVSYWRDGNLCFSHLSSEADWPDSNIDFPYADRLVFRSWSGAWDRELICQPRD
ncbi:hypothetical protein [Uliginosibacterium sp. H1]|uniref:hypothetical protein n=1 Tax=Uliginosibacterium sp. H1 TaxID=3114757 RepID=UPI002E1736DB|nr:hypothetical protein [Uliginosibacterium sp. H1]